jgi:pimeloyl-ACP methyl ester carboxylesterase
MTSFLNHAGGRIAYDVTGDGPLVVLAHGMGDLRASFRFLAPRLIERGYRVAATDVRGHGESSAGWGSYTNSDAGGDLAALIRHLGGPAFVVGHSFSGGSAVWLAAAEPSLVGGLVLIGAFTRPAPMNPLTKQMARLVLSSPALWGRYYASLYKGDKPADFAAYVAALKANLREPGRMAATRAMGLGTKADLDGRLARIEAPTLIINGAKDPDFPDPRAEAETIAAGLAGTAEIVMVDGAGHYPHVEVPEKVADAVLGFLKEQARA